VSAPVALTPELVGRQEARFAAAFAAGDITMARRLYQPDVVYLSPTTRLYGWPRRIEGLDQTLEFVQLTINGLHNVSYRVEESALVPGQDTAFVRARFEFGAEGVRLCSTYVVVYRYRAGLIAQQELFYDPSDRLERL
jgi:ketosteroid isomerase-like protein